MARNDLNREYIYVRRLISMLTNDDSDKLIVEKLKGKNLTSLLYNAKIIGNSKNMTANKKILACVIRAIEREKHLCHKREESWGRKFLNSFNCLYPGLKTEEDHTEQLIASRGCVREQKSCHKVIKHRALSKRMKTSSTRTPKTACTNSFKSRCQSSMRCGQKSTAEAGKLHLFKSKPGSHIGSFRNKTDSCIDSVVTDKPEDKDDMLRECDKLSQRVRVIYKSQKIMYEAIYPPLLRQKKLNCVMVYPGKPIPQMRTADKAEKKSSSTQTSDISYEPDIQSPKVPNNIKLQDLLEAASKLINARDQKEYVKTFLTNVEPPFDLSAGFPPYLKLPMKNSEDVVGKESVYGSNSELSLISDRLSPARRPQMTSDVMKQKEDNVRRYVRDLVSEPWQDTAESIISGVINETLPHDKADYSQLGACILKRLGAFPGSSSYKDTRYRRQNLNIPEIILQCTEFFESDVGDSDLKPEPTVENCRTDPVENSSLDKSPASIEMKLADESSAAKPLDIQGTQNYCFLDSGSASSQRVAVLNLSESSLVDIGTCQNEVAAQGDASQDRKNLQLREPLKITPSGLEQGSKKPKKVGFERKWENKGHTKIPESRGVPGMQNLIPERKIDAKESKNPSKSARQKVSIYTVTSDKKQELSEGTQEPIDESAQIENISILKSESALVIPTEKKMEDKIKAETKDIEEESLVKIPAEITETETPPELANLHWEPAVAEVETFDGIGEGKKTLTDLPATKPDRITIVMPSKNCTSQEKTRSKKKRKAVIKKKPHSDKNGEGNCRVM